MTHAPFSQPTLCDIVISVRSNSFRCDACCCCWTDVLQCTNTNLCLCTSVQFHTTSAITAAGLCVHLNLFNKYSRPKNRNVKLYPTGAACLPSVHTAALVQTHWRAHQSNTPTRSLNGAVCGRRRRRRRRRHLRTIHARALSASDGSNNAIKY